MESTLLLADYARASDGKLDLIGAGWNRINAGLVSFGLGVLFEVSWDETNRKHRFTLDLLDADGAPAVDENLDKPVFHAEGEFEVGRPAGVKAGMTQNGPFACNVAGARLNPGQQYQFRLVVDGDEDNAACCSFMTRTAQPQSMAA